MASENSYSHKEPKAERGPEIYYDQRTMEPIIVPFVTAPREEKKIFLVDKHLGGDAAFVPVLRETVSIVILCRNNLEYTKKCIESIRKNTEVSYQLVVVDNGSSDGTCQYLEIVLKDRDVLIWNPKNIGFSSANNLGARVASGEYLCFLNNDCEVGSGWVRQLLEAAKNSALVGASVFCLQPDFRAMTFKFVGTGKEDNEWSYIEGWCLFLKREIFNFVGGFDTRFDPYLSEDADLSFKFKKYGMKIGKVENLRVKHHGSKTLVLEPSHEVREISQINNRKLFEKWMPSNSVEQLFSVVNEKKNIMVRRKGARGDVLLCTPILRKLRGFYPKSRIVFETDFPEMIQGSGLVDQIIRFREEKSDGYDLVFDLSYERPGHENYIDEMAACAGIDVDDRSLVFTVPESEIQWAREYIRNDSKRKIALHVGRSWKSREWPVDRFKKVGKYFVKNENCSFLCLGDKETPYLGLGKDCRGFSVVKTAALIKVADALLGIDSLNMHIAAAVGTPAVVIYGCTSPDVVWSTGPHYPVWIDDLPCKGCRHKAGGTFVDCGRGDYACLDQITVDMVSEKLRQCLRGK